MKVSSNYGNLDIVSRSALIGLYCGKIVTFHNTSNIALHKGMNDSNLQIYLLPIGVSPDTTKSLS